MSRPTTVPLMLAAIGLVMMARGATAEVVWSPDGRRVAWVIEVPEAGVVDRADWVLEPSAAVAMPRWRTARSALWTTDATSGRSARLDESSGPISPPRWSRDGRLFAYAKVAKVEPGKARLEVICRDETRSRVVLAQEFDDWATSAEFVSRSAVAFSPDGKYLVAPRVRPEGLAVIRVDSSRVVTSIENAMHPIWSSDGQHLLFVRNGAESHLESLESHFGAPRSLAVLGHAESSPALARGGNSALILARTSSPTLGGGSTERIDLISIGIDDGKRDLIAAVAPTLAADRVLLGAAMTMDVDGENAFSAASVEGVPSQVTWHRVREKQVFKKFPVLDPSLPITSLSLSPNSTTLAIRLGEPGSRGLPVLCDLATMEFTPICPDEPTLELWAGRLAAVAGAIVREAAPPAILEGRAVDRPVGLPFPGEIGPDSEAGRRLRRIGRFGLKVWDESKADDPLHDRDGSITRFLFLELAGSYTAALKTLDTLDESAGSAARREKLLALRAGVFAGMGDLDRSRRTLDYLRSLEPGRSRRVVETTSDGYRFAEARPGDLEWPSYALGRLATLELDLSEDGADPVASTDHRNFDAPIPGLGLDLEPPIQPAIPERMIPGARPARP